MAFFEQQPQQQNQSKERTRGGRTTIEDRRRTGSYSDRAFHGKILVTDDNNCPKCHHHKAIENVNSGVKATRYGQIKCSSCGHMIKESHGI